MSHNNNVMVENKRYIEEIKIVGVVEENDRK